MLSLDTEVSLVSLMVFFPAGQSSPDSPFSTHQLTPPLQPPRLPHCPRSLRHTLSSTLTGSSARIFFPRIGMCVPPSHPAGLSSTGLSSTVPYSMRLPLTTPSMYVTTCQAPNPCPQGKDNLSSSNTVNLLTYIIYLLLCTSLIY